jgi:hypothetical protein
MVHALGFDYFDDWLDATGDPSSIDQTAGGVALAGTWSCGFVRDANHGGADTGACYASNNTCSVITKSRPEAPGRICRDSGRIFDPNQACANSLPSYTKFATLSGHTVSPLVIIMRMARSCRCHLPTFARGTIAELSRLMPRLTGSTSNPRISIG